MPNKRGRPLGSKSNKPPKPQIRFTITLETQDQKEQLKELGGSAWVRKKLKVEKEKRDEI
jgi:hypothetical protein